MNWWLLIEIHITPPKLIGPWEIYSPLATIRLAVFLTWNTFYGQYYRAELGLSNRHTISGMSYVLVVAQWDSYHAPQSGWTVRDIFTAEYCLHSILSMGISTELNEDYPTSTKSSKSQNYNSGHIVWRERGQTRSSQPAPSIITHKFIANYSHHREQVLLTGCRDRNLTQTSSLQFTAPDKYREHKASLLRSHPNNHLPFLAKICCHWPQAYISLTIS